MEISPCCAGWSVCAAAAAIGALPIPASLEKIPLAIPFCIATIMAPIAPPAAARNPKALFTIVTIAPGIAVTLNIRIKSADTTYKTAIKGTTTCATLEILCNPPISTSATHNVISKPEITTLQE